MIANEIRKHPKVGDKEVVDEFMNGDGVNDLIKLFEDQMDDEHDVQEFRDALRKALVGKSSPDGYEVCKALESDLFLEIRGHDVQEVEDIVGAMSIPEGKCVERWIQETGVTPPPVGSKVVWQGEEGRGEGVVVELTGPDHMTVGRSGVRFPDDANNSCWVVFWDDLRVVG